MSVEPERNGHVKENKSTNTNGKRHLNQQRTLAKRHTPVVSLSRRCTIALEALSAVIDVTLVVEKIIVNRCYWNFHSTIQAFKLTLAVPCNAGNH